MLSAYFLLFFVTVISMVVFGLFQQWINNTFLEYSMILVFYGFLFLILHKIAKYFEYDSDGDVLVLINKGIVISEFFNYRENKAEFPKTKLLYYKLNNYIIYKSLNLYIRSGENRQKRLKFNVSLVSNKKLKYLKMSLNKVVKHNKVNR